MDALITSLGASLGAEALKTWGVFVIVLVLLGLMLWHQRQELKAEKAEKEALRLRIEVLQDKRLEDAQKLMRVTEAGTATMASRSEGDQKFLGAFQDLANTVADLGDTVSEIKNRVTVLVSEKQPRVPPPRQPGRREGR